MSVTIKQTRNQCNILIIILPKTNCIITQQTFIIVHQSIKLKSVFSASCCTVRNPPLCLQLHPQQPDQQLYPQEKDQSVIIMDSKLTPWCSIFKWLVHGYSAGHNITAVLVDKGSSVCEI
jgi:hypothetical protein